MAAPARREPRAAGGAVAWRPAGDVTGGGEKGGAPGLGPAPRRQGGGGGRWAQGCRAPPVPPVPARPRSLRPRRWFPRCYSPPRRYRREAGPGLRPQEPRPRGVREVWPGGPRREGGEASQGLRPLGPK